MCFGSVLKQNDFRFFCECYDSDIANVYFSAKNISCVCESVSKHMELEKKIYDQCIDYFQCFVLVSKTMCLVRMCLNDSDVTFSRHVFWQCCEAE